MLFFCFLFVECISIFSCSDGNVYQLFVPKQFSEDNSADDISIVLSFADTNDERIEEAVDELQERRLKE